MNHVLSEKDYQNFLLERLEKDNGYVIRKATHFDRSFAMDREMLFQFLNGTQPDTMDYLRKIYKDDLEDTIVSFINTETTKTRGSLIDVLKHGIEISNQKLELMYTKPATTFNPDLTKKYSQNIFSVMEEVWASDKERIDVVIFLNGLAIISFELKCNTAGQSYQDAIYQYRTQRNPKTRLFLFKAGCLVNFAMDLEEVYMTTKLAGDATFFLPFNMGNGDNLNLTLNDSVLNYRKTLQSQADASFYISREDLHAVLTGQAKMADLVKAKKAKIIGNGAKLEEIIACLDNFDLWVNIVTPN